MSQSWTWSSKAVIRRLMVLWLWFESQISQRYSLALHPHPNCRPWICYHPNLVLIIYKKSLCEWCYKGASLLVDTESMNSIWMSLCGVFISFSPEQVFNQRMCRLYMPLRRHWNYLRSGYVRRPIFFFGPHHRSFVFLEHFLKVLRSKRS